MLIDNLLFFYMWIVLRCNAATLQILCESHLSRKLNTSANLFKNCQNTRYNNLKWIDPSSSTQLFYSQLKRKSETNRVKHFKCRNRYTVTVRCLSYNTRLMIIDSEWFIIKDCQVSTSLIKLVFVTHWNIFIQMAACYH